MKHISKAGDDRLILYSKNDCPLCDELTDEFQRRRISYTKRAITSNRTWYDEYHQRIPVTVLPDGSEYDGIPEASVLDGWQALYS